MRGMYKRRRGSVIAGREIVLHIKYEKAFNYLSFTLISLTICSLNFFMCNLKIHSNTLYKYLLFLVLDMSGWPSGVRRRTQEASDYKSGGSRIESPNCRICKYNFTTQI